MFEYFEIGFFELINKIIIINIFLTDKSSVLVKKEQDNSIF